MRAGIEDTEMETETETEALKDLDTAMGTQMRITLNTMTGQSILKKSLLIHCNLSLNFHQNRLY